MEKILYLVRGCPGSGKSTFSKTLVGEDSLICEADKYFVVDGVYKFDGSKLREAHTYCRDMVETYMKDSLINDQNYRKIVVSNTFTQLWEMSPYFELAEKYNYMVFTIIVENRHGGINQHNVPEDKIEIMKNRFEIKL